MINRLPILVVSVGLILALSGFESVEAQPTDIQNWDVTWFDEFNGNSLDTSIWDAINTNIPTNNSRQAYRSEQLSLNGGNLVITSEQTPANLLSSTNNLPYMSGQVISKAAQQYGRFEVRAKLPTSTGMWPAIWLLPDVNANNWPSQGEIDIMENRGDEPNTTSSAFHYGSNPPYVHNFQYQEQRSVSSAGTANYHDSFHTYAAEWDSSQVRFYVDDVHHYTVFDSSTNGFLSNQTAGMELVLNTAVGGHFLDNPDSSTVWPQTFEIDYVHAYERSDAAYQLEFDNGSFESSTASLAQWSTFGNSISNVSTSDLHVNEGTEALKLYGQFSGGINASGVQQGLTVESGQELVASVDAFISSSDSIANTNNKVVLNIDYFSQPNGQFDSNEHLTTHSLLIADGSTLENNWLDRELNAIVPAGAVEARLALVFVQPDQQSGAVFLDNVDFAIVSDAIPGDFDNDGDVDVDDVDAYEGVIGQPASANPAMDLDNDTAISIFDHDLLVQTLLETSLGTGALIGDLNLDGDVDVSQFNPATFKNEGDASILLANLGTLSGASYAMGDLNADGDVDISQFDPITFQNLGDASRLLANLGQSQYAATATTSAVPEPSALLGVMTAWGGALLRRRR